MLSDFQIMKMRKNCKKNIGNIQKKEKLISILMHKNDWMKSIQKKDELIDEVISMVKKKTEVKY
jgi:hypothetical protein